MAGRLTSFTGIAAIAGLLATLVTHLGPAARTARVVVEDAAPAIRQIVEHAPEALQVVTALPINAPEEPPSPPQEQLPLNASVAAITAPSRSPHPVDEELQRELAIEEAQRSVSTAVAVPASPPAIPDLASIPVASATTADPRPMSAPQLRRCLDYKDAVAKAVEKALTAKAALDDERTRLLARDTELSSALAEDAGQDPVEHLRVQVQADQLRADVAAHDRMAIEVRHLADSAQELGDRYNRACSGRKYSQENYQAALQMQTHSPELPTP